MCSLFECGAADNDLSCDLLMDGAVQLDLHGAATRLVAPHILVGVDRLDVSGPLAATKVIYSDTEECRVRTRAAAPRDQSCRSWPVRWQRAPALHWVALVERNQLGERDVDVNDVIDISLNEPAEIAFPPLRAWCPGTAV